MITLDTNILVRVLIDDVQQMHQVNAAREFVKKHSTLFIPQIVQVELVWVLEAAYKVEKNEIINVLRHLEENDAFQLQRRKQYEKALDLYQNFNADFSDCLIQAESIEANSNVITFDKKFYKLPQVQLIKTKE